MEYGGITPIGLPSGWPVLIDPAVLEQRRWSSGAACAARRSCCRRSLLTELPGAEVVEGLAS